MRLLPTRVDLPKSTRERSNPCRLIHQPKSVYPHPEMNNAILHIILVDVAEMFVILLGILEGTFQRHAHRYIKRPWIPKHSRENITSSTYYDA